MKRKAAARANKSTSLSSVLSTPSASTRLRKITDRKPYESGCDINRGCDINWVQDCSPENSSQSAYIKRVREETYSWGSQSTSTSDSDGCLVTHMVGTTLTTSGGITKDISGLTSDEYIQTRLMAKKCLPTPPSMQHFPVKVKNDCNIVPVYTPEQAIDAGLLPPNWGQPGGAETTTVCN